ncbi:MAG: hypothetical protein H6595_00300 [Flavobacteriales bacterium]|nr:hypothetical protein [Flavobacteriales bacterium]MCB9165900.1 hypothetical protein [Flavobacteriales bacterium]
MKHNKVLFVFLGLVVLGYVVLRSWILDITYDEAWTLDGFVGAPVIDIVSYSTPIANNHVINTLLIKLLFSIGGESVFLSRLPNIFSCILYLFYSYRISIHFFNGIFRISLFVLLVTNSFLLEFFGLARGYGLALSFDIVSIYYLLAFNESKKWSPAYSCIIFASISVICSFSVIFHFIGVVIAINYLQFSSTPWKPRFFRLMFGSLGLSAILAGVLYLPLTRLIAADALWYGGKTGIYGDTLFSLVSCSLGDVANDEIVSIVLAGSVAIFLVVAMLSLAIGGRKDAAILERTRSLLILTFVPMLAMIMAHHAFGTNYPIDRTALFIIPTVSIAFVQFSSELHLARPTTLARSMTTLLATISILIFTYNFNLTNTTIWFQDAHTRDILGKLDAIGQKSGVVQKLDADWPFRASILYYTVRGCYPNVAFVEDEPANLDISAADYYLHLCRSLEKVGYFAEDPVLSYHRDTIMYFEREGILLLSNTPRPDREQDHQ